MLFQRLLYSIACLALVVQARRAPDTEDQPPGRLAKIRKELHDFHGAPAPHVAGASSTKPRISVSRITNIHGSSSAIGDGGIPRGKVVKRRPPPKAAPKKQAAKTAPQQKPMPKKAPQKSSAKIGSTKTASKGAPPKKVAPRPAPKKPTVKTGPKASPKKTPPKKTPPKKTPPKKTLPKKTPPKKTPAVKAPPRKTPPKKTPPKKTPPKKTPAVKAPPRKTPSRKTPSRKTPSPKTPSPKTPSRKTPSRKGQSKKAPSRNNKSKTTPRKTPARKTSSKQKTHAQKNPTKTTAKKNGSKKSPVKNSAARKDSAKTSPHRKNASKKFGSKVKGAGKNGPKSKHPSRKSHSRAKAGSKSGSKTKSGPGKKHAPKGKGVHKGKAGPSRKHNKKSKGRARGKPSSGSRHDSRAKALPKNKSGPKRKSGLKSSNRFKDKSGPSHQSAPYVKAANREGVTSSQAIQAKSGSLKSSPAKACRRGEDDPSCDPRQKGTKRKASAGGNGQGIPQRPKVDPASSDSNDNQSAGQSSGQSKDAPGHPRVPLDPSRKNQVEHYAPDSQHGMYMAVWPKPSEPAPAKVTKIGLKFGDGAPKTYADYTRTNGHPFGWAHSAGQEPSDHQKIEYLENNKSNPAGVVRPEKEEVPRPGKVQETISFDENNVGEKIDDVPGGHEIYDIEPMTQDELDEKYGKGERKATNIPEMLSSLESQLHHFKNHKAGDRDSEFAKMHHSMMEVARVRKQEPGPPY